MFFPAQLRQVKNIHLSDCSNPENLEETHKENVWHDMKTVNKAVDQKRDPVTKSFKYSTIYV